MCAVQAQQPPTIPALIEQLGSAKFSEREAAFKALRKIGKAAFPLLEKAESHADVEVSSRARKLTAPYHQERHVKLAKTLMPSVYPRCPWIYQGSYSCDLVFSYLGREELASTSNGAPDWTRYREATRLHLYDMLRGGSTEKECVAELDRMAQAEIDWINRNGKSYVPPITLPGDFVPDF